MDHEFESEWRQLGPLANSVLRSVMEKRMKQAEMTEAKPQAKSSVLHPAQREFRAQLDLPLFPAVLQPVVADRGQEPRFM